MSRVKKISITLGVLAGLFLLFTVLSVAVIYEEHTQMCSICGSVKSETTLVFFIPISRSVKTTELGKWIIKQQKIHKHKWCSIVGNGNNIFGHTLVRAHGPAPEIHHLSTSGMLDEFIKSASDEEIGQFVKTMKTGTRDEKKNVTKKIYDETVKEKGILCK